MKLTEAEDIKSWQEYIDLYKKDLHDPDNHDGVIIHQQPDYLEFEVKWNPITSTSLFVVRLPKGHLTSYSRMPGSR